jgi:HlyD family secretion protein
MDSNRSTISSILFALAIAAAVAVGASYYLPQANVASKLAAKATNKPLPKVRWEAAAPGRVEPNGGEIRIGSVMPGRIVEVTVKPNDRVSTGDLLVRLSDDEAMARLHAARAEAAVRKRERDTAEANPTELVRTRRQAQDAAMDAETALSVARAEMDTAFIAFRREATADTRDQLDRQRTAVRDAETKLDAARTTQRRAEAAAGIPLPTRVEAGLTAARAAV